MSLRSRPSPSWISRRNTILRDLSPGPPSGRFHAQPLHSPCTSLYAACATDPATRLGANTLNTAKPGPCCMAEVAHRCVRKGPRRRVSYSDSRSSALLEAGERGARPSALAFQGPYQQPGMMLRGYTPQNSRLRCRAGASAFQLGSLSLASGSNGELRFSALVLLHRTGRRPWAPCSSQDHRSRGTVSRVHACSLTERRGREGGADLPAHVLTTATPSN
jgi:hypothetical protein